jgi:hypothetical protein
MTATAMAPSARTLVLRERCSFPPRLCQDGLGVFGPDERDFSRLLLGVRSEVRVRLGEQFDASRNAAILQVIARIDIAVERTSPRRIRLRWGT